MTDLRKKYSYPAAKKKTIQELLDFYLYHYCHICGKPAAGQCYCCNEFMCEDCDISGIYQMYSIENSTCSSCEDRRHGD